MNTNQIQLSQEVVDEIKQAAKNTLSRASKSLQYSAGYFDGYYAGATAYATKLHHAISILEQNYKSYHESKKCFTTEEIEASWKRYKANNNL